jgi:Peptidase family C25/CARDB
MKKLYFILFCCVLFPHLASAQVYGNEWINYSQRYLKIKVTTDAVYRIDSTTLSNTLNAIGFPLSSINPQNFQLFHNGEEEYIWIEGESDNVFNSSDYIEFVGRRNDGAKDSALYRGTNNPLNPYYSIYNDTAVYFLTWNSLTTNRRLTNPNDTNFSAYTPAPYFLNEEINYGTYGYIPGIEDPNGMSDPDFLSSEGWSGPPFYYGQTNTTNLNSQFAYSAGPDALIRMRVNSASNDWNVSNDNHLNIQFLSTNFDTFYDGYAVADYYFTTPASNLSASSLPIAVSSIVNNGSVSSGRTHVSWTSLLYPHTFNMEGRQRFSGLLPDNPNGPKSLLQMNNIGGGGPVRIYDLYNHQRIDAVNNSGNWLSLVQNGNGSEKSFFLHVESAVVSVNTIEAAGINGLFTDYSLQSGDSVFVIITHPQLMGVGQNYKNYRSSIAGGSHDVVLADITELYDQFAWGIGGHPLSIRHFSDYMIQTFPTKPGHLLLLGKSHYSYDARFPYYYARNMVPTIGYPPCDNLFTSGLNGTSWEPAIPTGRIAAQTATEAQWYLDKVIDYENNQPDEWMKHVLHFGGGTSLGEQALYKLYLAGYENTIEDTLFGGIVQSYLKTSSAPIQINQSDSLRRRIEDGVSIMTFFGHASGTGFDQSIDDPTTYNNVGRYPLLIANSCYAGDIHSTGISSSESFTLLNQKGTIGYIASVGLGLAPFLNVYTDNLYRAIGQRNYGQTIGQCMQAAIDSSENVSPQSLQMKATCYEMTLQGDPAVVINSFPQPDYQITNNDVWIDQISQPDSITIYAEITNLGRAIRDTFIVQLFRKFPNGDSITYLQQVLAPKFKDTISFTIPVDQQRGPGLNKIRVTIDFFGEIAEMREDNNITNPDIDLLIYGSSIVPVYPYEFAVVPADTITLRASTVNPLEPIKQYRFQIDTTDTYDSPFLQSFVILSPGGVVNWKPNLLGIDSMVYFWRVSPDSLTANDVFIWRESSFQSIANQTGWGQDHIYQFKNDGYQFAKLQRPSRDFAFVNDIKSLIVTTGHYEAWWLGDTAGIPWNESLYKINGATQHIFTCNPNGISIVVIDPVTGIPWSYTSLTGGQQAGGYINCVPGQPLNAFDFPDHDSVSCNYIRDFINAVPNGYRVLVYSQYYNTYHHYPYNASVLAAFGNIGSSVVGSGIVPDSATYIVFGTKGAAAGTATEVFSPLATSPIQITDTITTNWTDGFISSPIIGPAVSWNSFHWKQHEYEQPDYDSVYVDVYGIDANGQQTGSPIASFNESTTDVVNFSNYVNAIQYPYIRLFLRLRDDSSRTPAQIDRWHVLYAPYPDAAVNPQRVFSFHNDSLQEGAIAKLVVGVENVTPWTFTDSLLIRYWVVDHSRSIVSQPQQLRAPAFYGYTWFADMIQLNTTGLSGMNELWMEVNPIGYSNSQLEQYHFNNVLMVPFYVSTDRINPLLDVTFDGVHIMDGDIVSAKPSVLITLRDENQFLALNDTGDFNVFLRTPSQSVPVLIPWNSQMIFTPAVLPNNSCKIQFIPDCTEDGTYELIVQAKDRSDNISGILDYKISFEVINKPSITNVLNYPNPFTTSTQFVFTLTGSEVPELFTIQIMTITGKVVREINRDELGDIHIGRNVTDFTWDGRDQYGDQLANGVYLYRIITRLNGTEIEHRESGADPYITQGWGKMYLMR